MNLLYYTSLILLKESIFENITNQYDKQTINIKSLNYTNNVDYCNYTNLNYNVEYYDNGNVKYERHFKDVIYHDEGKVYYENGNVQYEGNFRNGKAKHYYENGNLAYEGYFKDDKLNGKGKIYYENGNLWYEGYFKDDIFNGKGKYYPRNNNIRGDFIDILLNGKLDYEDYFKYGLINGKAKFYHKNGNLWYEGYHKNGKIRKKGRFKPKYYDENGNLLYEDYFKDDKGKYYHKNGNIRNEGDFKENIQDSDFKENIQDSNLKDDIIHNKINFEDENGKSKIIELILKLFCILYVLIMYLFITKICLPSFLYITNNIKNRVKNIVKNRIFIKIKQILFRTKNMFYDIFKLIFKLTCVFKLIFKLPSIFKIIFRFPSISINTLSKKYKKYIKNKVKKSIIEYLECPISLEIMKNPVSIETGHTFEEIEIKQHFRLHNTNPLTNLPLKTKKLTQNIVLKQIIDYLET